MCSIRILSEAPEDCNQRTVRKNTVTGWNKHVNTNKLNPRLSLPLNIAGEHEPAIIANRFMKHFKVSSSIDRVMQVVDPEETATELTIRFSANDVTTVIKNMWRAIPRA